MNINEIQLQVAKHLQPPDLLACALVCKDWHSAFILELYRNLTFTSTDQWDFPYHEPMLQLVASLYRFRSHINSLRLDLFPLQTDKLLFNLENRPLSEDKATLETISPVAATRLSRAKADHGTLIRPRSPLFPNLESLSMNIYHTRGGDLSWLAHCPRLRSLCLSIPRSKSFRDTLPWTATMLWSDILALPVWSTTLTHLQISGGSMYEELEILMLRQCTSLTDLAFCPRDAGAKVLAESFQSLRHLDMSGDFMDPWATQMILSTLTGLEKLSLRHLEVKELIGIDWAFVYPSLGKFGKEWTCTRLKSLRIVALEWSSEPHVNTDLLIQLARLKELESLEIETMGYEEGCTTVLHHFPMETPWNLGPCKEPLPWMTGMWPKLKRYRSEGFKDIQRK